MEEEIMSTKGFFKSHDINLSDYWLESCIQWCREENPHLNDSLETLHLKVYAQWLLLDLRDVEVPILPQNISQQKKLMLNGIYTLQLLHVIDISRSQLSQIEKMRNGIAVDADLTSNQNNQNSNFGKRMLQMLLTDGVQNIEAIEYKTINVLNINLKPGTKIKITGPVMVRRGQMLLEEKHIKILGGEVEELLISNAPENVLARALNLPENPNPNIEESEVVTNPQRNTTIIQVPVITDPSKDIKIKQHVNVKSQQTIITSYLIDKKNETIVNNTSNIKRQSANDDDKMQHINKNFITQEEELRINAEVDMLLEAERDMAEEYPFLRESPDIFENFEPIEEQHSRVQQNKSTANNLLASTSKFNKKMEASMFEDMDIDIDAHLDLIDQQINLKKDELKIVTINDLLNKTDHMDNEFTIKAKFKTVVQKLSVRNDNWFLKLLIGDETGNMEVQLQSEIITKLMGYSPSDIMVLKNNIMKKDENAKITVMEILEGLKQEIVKIDGEMVIKYTSTEDCPSIIKLKTDL